MWTDWQTPVKTLPSLAVGMYAFKRIWILKAWSLMWRKCCASTKCLKESLVLKFTFYIYAVLSVLILLSSELILHISGGSSKILDTRLTLIPILFFSMHFLGKIGWRPLSDWPPSFGNPVSAAAYLYQL